MNTMHRLVFAILAVMVLAGISAAPAAAAADPNVAHVDGYLDMSQPGCIIMRDHNNKFFALTGRVVGLVNGDHVRLEGRFAPNQCGQAGFAVTQVQAIWADDRHKTTYYDHLKDGSFRPWAERNGRVHGEPEWRDYPPRR
jgi:hypothetical protein